MQNSKMKKKSKTNSNFYKIKIKQKNSLVQQELQQLRDKNLSDQNIQACKRKQSLKVISRQKTKPKNYRFLQTHDQIFLDIVQNQNVNKLNQEKNLKTMKNIKDSQIVLSKDVFTSIVSKLIQQNQKQNSNKKNLFSRKSSKSQSIKNKSNSFVNKEKLIQLRQKAIKQLVNEEFDLKGSKDLSKIKSQKEIDQKLVLLFQKEMLLENMLQVLDQNKIDVNQILYSAFENIQCENYIPQTGNSLIEDGYFQLEDKIQHTPISQFLTSSVKQKLKIDLNSVRNDESEENSSVPTFSENSNCFN